MRIRSVLTGILQILWLGTLFSGSATFGWFFYERYWKWRDCIDMSVTSCGDPASFNATDGGAIWIVPCLVLLVVALGSSLHFYMDSRRLP